jgi:hypothetical protein
MKRKWLGLLMLVASSAWAECDYAYSGAKLEQCRPIELIDRADGPAWTYVEGPKAGVIAHLLCACTSTLAAPDKYCPAVRTDRLTTTLETNDILATCARRDALCQDVCRSALTPKN